MRIEVPEAGRWLRASGLTTLALVCGWAGHLLVHGSTVRLPGPIVSGELLGRVIDPEIEQPVRGAVVCRSLERRPILGSQAVAPPVVVESAVDADGRFSLPRRLHRSPPWTRHVAETTYVYAPGYALAVVRRDGKGTAIQDLRGEKALPPGEAIELGLGWQGRDPVADERAGADAPVPPAACRELLALEGRWAADPAAVRRFGEEAVDRLLADLEGADRVKAIAAASRLEQVGASRARVLEPLARAARGPEPDRRRAAAAALLVLGPDREQGVAVFTHVLDVGPEDQRRWALSVLARRWPDDPATLEALSRAVVSTRSGVQAEALSSLCRHDPAAGEALARSQMGRLLHSSSQRELRIAAERCVAPPLWERLGGGGDPADRLDAALEVSGMADGELGMPGRDPTPVAAALVAGMSSDRRPRRVVMALRRLGERARPAVPMLLDLAAAEPRLRSSVGDALVRIDRQAAAAFILGVLRDPRDEDPSRWLRLAGELGRVEGDAQVELEAELLDHARSETWMVRSAAIDALADSLPPDRAERVLIGALADESRSIRQSAIARLEREGHESSTAVEALVRAWKDDPQLVVHVARALVRLDPRQAVAVIGEALARPDPRHRRDLLIQLQRVGSRGREARTAVVATLEEALGEKGDAWTAVAALEALVAIDAAGSVRQYLEALGSVGAPVRVAAARGLGRSRSREALEPLTALLEDRDVSVRGAAIAALGELGPAARAAIPALERLRGDPIRARRLGPALDEALRRVEGRGP